MESLQIKDIDERMGWVQSSLWDKMLSYDNIGERLTAPQLEYMTKVKEVVHNGLFNYLIRNIFTKIHIYSNYPIFY